MERGILCSLCVFLATTAVLADAQKNAEEALQTYIVQTSKSDRPTLFSDEDDWYDSITRHHDVLYNYKSAFTGFAVRMTPSQAKKFAKQPGIVSLTSQRIYHPTTTHSIPFLGLNSNSPFYSKTNQGKGVIIGMLDTGADPKSPSFNDKGMDPPPARWKGKCKGRDFPCNNKIIGAKYFAKAAAKETDANITVMSARDIEGHGTHTASTAAGSPVPNMNIHGRNLGTGQGVASKAWLAIYKVCWDDMCVGADILAAVDEAVRDGVDIISGSLGTGPEPYEEEAFAIGCFAAAEKGVFVALSAGNEGPGAYTVSNNAPWVTTVAASTTNRLFPAYATLGDGRQFLGESMSSAKPLLANKQLPLIYAPTKNPRLKANASVCMPGTLDSALVKGKVVVCDRGINARTEKSAAVKQGGGVGFILANDKENGDEGIPDPHVLPSVSVGYNAGIAIKAYITSTRRPTAYVKVEERIGSRVAPKMAPFSSRGPNKITQEILKPDITAPGVNIVAAWTQAPEAADRANFTMISGTSMSTPHVSGVAALLKASHPDWSPAAIRSAMMTTSYTVATDGKPLMEYFADEHSTPYAYGAGHVDPDKADDPGLVYDINGDDYVNFLCSTNLQTGKIMEVVRRNFSCSNKLRTPGDLNYPSFSVVFGDNRHVVSYQRTVTNVGAGASRYQVSVNVPERSVKVDVQPAVLNFRQKGQKLSYKVTFRVFDLKALKERPFALFGTLEWKDRKHRVRSPIVFSMPHNQ